MYKHSSKISRVMKVDRNFFAHIHSFQSFLHSCMHCIMECASKVILEHIRKPRVFTVLYYSPFHTPCTMHYSIVIAMHYTHCYCTCRSTMHNNVDFLSQILLALKKTALFSLTLSYFILFHNIFEYFLVQ